MELPCGALWTIVIHLTSLSLRLQTPQVPSDRSIYPGAALARRSDSALSPFLREVLSLQYLCAKGGKANGLDE